jgi:4-hydroxy-2-oxoheptanedioate aldolase
LLADLASRLRSREQLVGYWIASDNPVMTERLARTGYDYLCLDLQHGLIDYAGCIRGLTAIDTGPAAGLVRVPANDPAWIGRALDAGARGVVVPLINSAAEARRAVSACRYPPSGTRSYGPMRASLRIGPEPTAADASVACIVMIETSGALRELDAICAVPGVDAVYVGPSDLALALGARRPAEGPSLPAFGRALEHVAACAEKAGLAAGLHCSDGESAAQALATGFTFVSISNDLNHLTALAAAHLSRARGHDDD